MALTKAEIGTLTFAIINIATVTLSTAASLGTLLFLNANFVLESHEFQEKVTTPRYHIHIIVPIIMQLSIVICWIAFSLVNLVFASFLLNGIIKKKPEHMKAYFVFGIVIMVLTSFVVVGVSVFNNYSTFYDNDPTPIVVFLGAYLMYSLVLYMIRYTYTKMELTNNQYGHKKLESLHC